MSRNCPKPKPVFRLEPVAVLLAFLAIGIGSTPALARTPEPVSNWVPAGSTTFLPVIGSAGICGSQGLATDGRSLWFSWNFGLARAMWPTPPNGPAPPG